jgi:hypothetical protein
MKRTGAFLTTCKLTPMPDGETWRLYGPLKYRGASGEIINVPEGFVTDLASIPPVAWIGGVLVILGLGFDWLNSWSNIAIALGLLFVFLSPYLRHDGKYTDAAVVHDYIYRIHMFPRWHCDGLFLEMMKVLHVTLWQRWIIYLNVRAFGFMAWRNEKRWINIPVIHLTKP